MPWFFGISMFYGTCYKATTQGSYTYMFIYY